MGLFLWKLSMQDIVKTGLMSKRPTSAGSGRTSREFKMLNKETVLCIGHRACSPPKSDFWLATALMILSSCSISLSFLACNLNVKLESPCPTVLGCCERHTWCLECLPPALLSRPLCLQICLWWNLKTPTETIFSHGEHGSS